MSRFWPITDLRLETVRLTLRPTTEDDLAALAAIFPNDSELDPSLPALPIADRAAQRGAAVHQAYWRAQGSWRPESWNLGFSVFHQGRLCGQQALEADDFARRLVVDSNSWLSPAVRGVGLGKEMRAAVLHLAFGGLGALEAETTAWWDNAASLGVSAALGYEPNGEHIHVDGARRDRMIRMRLTAARWQERGGTHPTKVEGLEGCRHLFGAAGR